MACLALVRITDTIFLTQRLNTPLVAKAVAPSTTPWR